MSREASRKLSWKSVSDAARDAHEMSSLVKGIRTRMAVGSALQNDRVRLAFQPVVDTQDTQRVAFWEALVRLRDRDGAIIAPHMFLPAIRGTSLAVMLDCQVLRLALDQLAERPDLRISVNVGPDSFGHVEWCATLKDGLRRCPGIGMRLIVEVTENIVIDGSDPAQRFLADLREAGISIALDDFGGGTTSIRQFRDTRFDILKLDGSLCRNLAQDRDAQVLVGAMVQVAKHYEMMTVAEHIDSGEATAAAIRTGIDCLQGYRFGKPTLVLPGRDMAEAQRTAI